MVEVRSDIPIPGTMRRKREPNGAWSHMAVGESFFMRKVASAINGVYVRNQREDGKQFVCEERTEELDGVPVRGARVWRTA
jgi:hypothetical protein